MILLHKVTNEEIFNAVDLQSTSIQSISQSMDTVNNESEEVERRITFCVHGLFL
ncbi:hypothetical protein ACQZV8_00510 [Magnetococcales bacterium HHB-1]